MLKDRLSITSGWQFHKWLFGPEKFSGLTGPRFGSQSLRHMWVEFVGSLLSSERTSFTPVFPYRVGCLVCSVAEYFYELCCI